MTIPPVLCQLHPNELSKAKRIEEISLHKQELCSKDHYHHSMYKLTNYSPTLKVNAKTAATIEAIAG